MNVCIAVLVPTPAHAGLAATLDYLHSAPLPAGTLVRVPLGRRAVLGVVWERDAATPASAPERLRTILEVWDGIAPLDAQWRALIAFAARYYRRSLGELALAALPAALRQLDAAGLARRRTRRRTANVTSESSKNGHTLASNATNLVALDAGQTVVLEQFHTGNKPALLFGATGSGKTEVYLRCIETLLEQNAQAQALLLVPEINLTPQLQARVEARFVPRWGETAVVALHSALTPAQRLRHWLSAHNGEARIVLGTRLAIFTPMAGLGLIVVDEEHDPSYRAQDGARYSARDLALVRGQQCGASVLLGSATPSLESWHHSRPDSGRLRRLLMPQRVQGALQPRVRRLDMRPLPRDTLLAPSLIQAIHERACRGEQSLLLLNRRGYAPVLHCGACGWKSACPHCSAYRVFHKRERSLRCHHCGLGQPVPRACPDCGNPDIQAVGRGTERLEEQLQVLLEPLRRPNPDGEGSIALRLLRIDADSARGTLSEQLAQVHAGAVDVVLGTQMIAKGHDFRRVTLVIAVDPDGALFSQDFRAPERLFALLLQAAGRAGRDASLDSTSEVWVQTRFPNHALYRALMQHDFAGFAEQQLLERQQAGLPPFTHQALLRAEGPSQDVAQGFLQAARQALLQDAAMAALLPSVTLYPVVPMGMARLARVERAHLLLESASRPALHEALTVATPLLHALRRSDAGRGLQRWAIDVDPLSI